MVRAMNGKMMPFSLLVTGEAEGWLPALHKIVAPQFLVARQVRDDRELLDAVETGGADAAVLDDSAEWAMDVLRLLRMIRRVNDTLPVVVVVTGRRDRHWLEDALRLAAFSVVTRPLHLEELLRQIQRMMTRLDEMLRRAGPRGM